jgi:hypothetical protein
MQKHSITIMEKQGRKDTSFPIASNLQAIIKT